MTAEAEAREQEHEDAAWVRIATRLPHAELCGFLSDVERLYRINPLLEISRFERTAQDRYRLVARNHSNGQSIDVELAVTAKPAALEAVYATGLKAATLFRAEPRAGGSDLVVTDIYGGSLAERQARAAEADLSLNAWGRALHDYLATWARWSRLQPWRWYMRHVWQPMTPSARRIVWMIWVISAFEVVALALLVAVWSLLKA